MNKKGSISSLCGNPEHEYVEFLFRLTTFLPDKFAIMTELRPLGNMHARIPSAPRWTARKGILYGRWGRSRFMFITSKPRVFSRPLFQTDGTVSAFER